MFFFRYHSQYLQTKACPCSEFTQDLTSAMPTHQSTTQHSQQSHTAHPVPVHTNTWAVGHYQNHLSPRNPCLQLPAHPAALIISSKDLLGSVTYDDSDYSVHNRSVMNGLIPRLSPSGAFLRHNIIC